MTERGVCVITHPLNAAGENATRTLLNILAAFGPVALVTADLPDDSSIRDEYAVDELTSKGTGESVVIDAGRFVLNQIRMCNSIRRQPADVILFFGATSYVLPILFARLLGKTVLVEPRGDVPLTLRLNWEQQMPTQIARILASLVGLLERTGFLVAHRVITYTPNMARELGLDPESSRVYPHGARYVDTEEFKPTTSFENRGDVVGYIGRINEEKGIRVLAEAARRLPDDITFRFVGDGNLRRWLERELAAEISDGAVECLDWVDHDEVSDELNRLRLLVMPSEPTEGLPTTILEALACGTPVLSTPVAGVPDVVREGETGFLIRDTSPDELAEAIRVSITHDNLATISRNGRHLVEESFSYDAAIRRYESILSDIPS